jgi:predicted adenylyl cyclase CyaB
MARNVEIKARIRSVEALALRVASIATEGPVEIRQDDTFFRCDAGRLKLRVFADGNGELIFYRRADKQDPKESFYLLAPTSSPDTLRELLTAAYGQVGRVRKHRTLFLVGRTRIHLDRVEGLGDFLELEVVLADGESADVGVDEAHDLMARLDVLPSQLAEGAYVDLLAQRRVSVSVRKASLDDVPVLVRLIADSARGLSQGDYTSEQIEAALGTAWGVDTELIHDGTYFVAEANAGIVGCGGWSRRRKLFGADAQGGQQSELLDPTIDSARIRAFFVRPGWARLGIGQTLLNICEAEARGSGFQSAELMATLPGQRLYQAYGYTGNERIEYPLSGELTIAFVPMKKVLA